MITCLLTNWGVTILLGLLLSLSEWLAKSKKFKQNGILDLVNDSLWHLLTTIKQLKRK